MTGRVFWSLIFVLAGLSAQPPMPMPQGQPPPAPLDPTKNGSIAGRVVNAGTGQPVRRASVTLIGTSGRGRMTLETDSEGQFFAPSVPPGEYRVFAQRNGFAGGGFGRGARGAATPVKVSERQTVTDVVLKLMPQAVIAGRVLDEENEPVLGASVQVYRFSYSSGRRALIQTDTATTNDLGEYRIYGLNTGKVVVAASYRQFSGPGPGPMPGNNGTASGMTYPVIYYPNANGPASASALQLTPGAEMRGIDFRLHRVRAVSVSGQVNTPKEIRRGGSVQLMPRDTDGSEMSGPGYSTGFGRGSNRFMIAAVPPGSYTLVAIAQMQDQPATAVMPIEVGQQPVTDLNITLSAPFAVSGRVLVDGEAGNVDLSQVKVALRPMGGARFGPQPEFEATTGGGFQLSPVAPGHYNVSVTGVSGSTYVKEIRQGTTPRPSFDLDLSVAAAIEVVLSAKGAQVSGSVANEKGEAAEGATVVLVPDLSLRSIPAFYRTANTAANGTFVLDGVPPGKYRLFAWDQVDSGSWYDPDFLAAYESSGESVDLSEGSRETKSLKLIVTGNASR